MKISKFEINIHDRVAEAYEGKLGKELQNATQKRIHWIRDNVTGKNILDIGSSQGIGPILLGRRGKKVLGIDISQKAIDEANQALLREKDDVQKNITFIKKDFLEYCEQKKFDTITITEVLEHLINPQAFIDKAKSLLIVNGQLIITVPFGINDHPDHKKTYYFLDLYAMLYPFFDLVKISILGKWIGVIVTLRNEIRTEKLQSIDINLLANLEGSFYKIERNLLNNNSELYQALQVSNEKYKNATKQVETTRETLQISNEKYKNSIKQIEKVKYKYDELNVFCKEEKKKYKEMSELLKYTEGILVEMKNQISILDKTLRVKEYELNEYKKSTSYQLGYLLLHKTRSFKDFILLPKRLFNIRNKKKLKSKKKIVKEIVSIRRNIKHKFILDKAVTELKIACIMDPFTYGSYAPEAIFMQLTPVNWKKELIEFSPDMLFVESAWRGKEELWWNSIGKKCDELVDIVTYCHKHHIPTVFWNKEDPIHFNTFINTATLFDFVFTTDIDMIETYKIMLQHNNVYLLPFACQPKNNNPIEKYNRKDIFCFAGAYYARYPERTKDLDEFMQVLPNLKPIEIYDRNYDKNDSNYMFPKIYKPFIVGSLPFKEIDKAYKGYNFAINLNSVKQSQSMFARRVYEVLASNTLVVSNFSKAVRLFFGDLVITSDNGIEMVNRVQSLISNDLNLRKHKLFGLRKALLEHTYEERLNFIVSKVFDRQIEKSLPSIGIISFVSSRDSYTQCMKTFFEQTYRSKKLVIISDIENLNNDNDSDSDVIIINYKDVKNNKISELATCHPYISLWAENDFYGKDYLMDLALATKYFDGDMIGKGCHYTYDRELTLSNEELRYQYIDKLVLGASIIKQQLINNYTVSEIRGIQTNIIENISGLCIDEFNYCRNGHKLDFKSLDIVEANSIPAEGISMKKFIDIIENQHVVEKKVSLSEYVSAKTLVKNMKFNRDIQIKYLDNNEVEIISNQNLDKHQNIYSSDFIDIKANNWDEKEKLYFCTKLGLELQLLIIYYDDSKRKISHQHILSNKNEKLSIPINAKWINFGFRVKGNGKIVLERLEFEYPSLKSNLQVGQSKHLVLTNVYPSYNDLYRNGFVHARIKSYKEEGIEVDVFSLQESEPLRYYEFENVDVTVGSSDILRNVLKYNNYENILVHFLDEVMWNVIKDYIGKTKIFVWVHGSEIQPWHRRKFDYKDENELEKAKLSSNKRMKFWKSILTSPHPKLKLIFVSQYFAEEVQKDIGIQIPSNNMVIIHNYINTDIFNFSYKNVEQRKEILSIRPFASNKYANDLSVKAILELSKKPYFYDLNFKIIGNGVLFDKLLEPLKKFENISIEKRFLSQSEIAFLHKQYGIFLTPTRMDAQGVSRDEAMSSGLIPITNNVAAIPEFVDTNCGILAKEDDFIGLAQGIAKIYEDPNLFQKMSQAAADRVRSQSSFNDTIKKEINLFATKKKIMIFGSCVSRDVFNIPNDFILTKYYARSSFASIFKNPFADLSIINNIESNFQKKIVTSDFSKEILKSLRDEDFDILLLDFIDERFNLLVVEGSIITLSNEAKKTDIERKYQDHHIIESGSEDFMVEWTQGWNEFITIMKNSGQLHKIVLNKVYWSTQTFLGDNYIEMYTTEHIIKMNTFLDKLYSIAEKSIYKENIMYFYADQMLGDDKHQWGKSPFHYVPEYYEAALKFLNNKK